MDGQSQRTSSGKGLRPLELGGGGGRDLLAHPGGGGSGAVQGGPT